MRSSSAIVADPPVLRRDLPERRPGSTTTLVDTVISPRSKSMSRRRRRPHSSARRRPVVAATKIARAYSGRRDCSAASISARTSSGVGTTGVVFGIDGGSAHCAGFESRQPHRQACVNIDERQAWIWYTLRGRQATALVRAVEIGEHLRGHLGHGHVAERRLDVARGRSSRSRGSCSASGPCAAARRSSRRRGRRASPCVPVCRPLLTSVSSAAAPSSHRARLPWNMRLTCRRLPGDRVATGLDDELPHARRALSHPWCGPQLTHAGTVPVACWMDVGFRPSGG